jgi:hypothetical protein
LACGEETLRVAGELLPGGGERDLAGGAAEEGDAEFLFKLADLSRERRLGDVERGRGASVVEPFGDGEEVAKLAQVEVER